MSLICTIAFGAFTATHAVDGCSSVGFKTATTLDLNAAPFGLATADFNTDGHLDLVATPNNGFNEIVILLGRGGTERFGPPTPFPTGGSPRRLAVGDFNGDGKPDLVVTLDFSGSQGPLPGQLSILLNDGTGKFGPPSLVSIEGGHPVRPVIADVNNDGKLDIVTGLSTSTTDGIVAVFLGNGSGGFTQAANSPFPTFSPTAALLVIGDFNEDDKPDLAIPNSSGGADILVGDGTGRFSPGIQTPVVGGGLSLTAADFNGDDHLDLLVENRMFLGTGNATFAAPVVVGLPENTGGVLAGDVNNDGHVDVVTGGASGLTIMLGNGTGALVRAQSYTSGFSGFGAGSSFAALGDFNEDGKIDLAVVQRLGIGILDGDGTGVFNDSLSYQASITITNYVLAADFNNDGKQDFAVSSSFLGFGGPNVSGVEVALGDGSGGFTRKSVSNFGTSPPRTMAAADLNGDGKPDLAVTSPSNGRITILINDGTGGFPTQGFSAPNFFVGGQVSAIRAGDFNNDTKADLIAITPANNSFFVLLGNGSGGFDVINSGQIQGTTSFWEDVAIGDFNADGKSDLAVIRSGETFVNVLQGDGAGHFSSFATAAIPGVPISIVAKDLNGDGKPDLAVTNSITDIVSRKPFVTVLINNGTGFNSGTSYPTDGAGMLGTGDFNSDNHPDLVVSSGSLQVGSSLDGVAVLTNKGNGEFNAPVNFSAGQVSDHLAVSDFNNDGKDDVLITQLFARSLGLLLGTVAPSQQCLSIDDVTVIENDTGTVNAVFTVKLSAASGQTVRVNYFAIPAFLFSSASPATRGVDFDALTGTVTFLPGETTQTITIPVKGDLIDEFDQFFFVSLTTPTNALISDGRGLGTIVDNDAPPALTINDVTVAEGTPLTQASAVFTVSFSATSEKPISFDYATQPGTASSNVDYFHISATLNLGGAASTEIAVPIIHDTNFEPDETFFLNLSNATNATIADGQGQATITNDDAQPAISIVETSFANEGAAGTTVNTQFDVTLSNPSTQTITVSFTTVDGTTTAGNDYVANSGTLTFNPGETSKSVSVQVIGDNVDEINETYFVNISNPTNATIGRAQSIGTIQDDDGPILTLGNASVVEGNSGFVSAVFTVTLSAPSPQDIFALYATGSGTATPGIDFQRVFSSTLFIPAGATSATLSVRIIPDFQIEPDEQFAVILMNVFNATVAAQGIATGTIVNDDSNGKFQFGTQGFSVSEDAGSILFSVNRVDGATGIATVDFATSNGTATAGLDYTAVSGTLTFVQGETSKAISIPILNDNLLESGETVNLTLSNPTGGAVLGTPATSVLTINSPPLILVLDQSGPGSHQATALDSLLLLRDPFPVLQVSDLLNPGPDKNTRVILFAANLQLAPGDAASIVKINLFDSSGQSHDVDAEDVRVATVPTFTQVTFRLPDNLRSGVCVVKIKSRDQESNTATIRIK